MSMIPLPEVLFKDSDPIFETADKLNKFAKDLAARQQEEIAWLNTRITSLDNRIEEVYRHLSEKHFAVLKRLDKLEGKY